ncbi:MAG: non-canonical purine NTP pyrophosphatase [Verrucomicrobiota bacterium]
MITLLIATRNAHKAGEIHAILGGGFRLLTLTDFPTAPTVVEDAPTFAGNATKKAVELAKWLAGSQPSTLNLHPLFVLADDSGLEVDALNGAPGVHSARFAAADSAKSGNTPDADNNAKLLRLLEDVPVEKRTARFHCVLALVAVCRHEASAWPKRSEGRSPVCYADEYETEIQLFAGVCEGRILFAPRGQNGFGYDPLFVPAGFEQSFAELGDEEKNRLSHRAKALEKLRGCLGRVG